MSFSSDWERIRAATQPGMTIQNWTADNGYFGDDFTIDAVSENAIDIRDPEVRVSKADFAAVLPLWPSYVAGVVALQDEPADATIEVRHQYPARGR